MISGLTSIVIPTLNHARWLPDAIESALAQTAPVEVIVVDDGSTDGTADLFTGGLAGRVRFLTQDHAGPSVARNAGLDAASGEFVMLLDADDVISRDKVARQLAAFDDEVGWVLCDVRIEDAARGRMELASERYDYRRKEIGGWIGSLLEPANFIPIMSPLVRRSVLAHIRFRDTEDGTPEDWVFWQQVAAVARVRYVPEVLATYRKQRTGRNRLPKAARAVVHNITQPLRLNLGCGTPGTRSWHPIDGFVNLDKSLDWHFEDGLLQFPDGSVAGISISHAGMYVPSEHWPFVFSEFSRVLAVGGIVRMTEDDTTNPNSARFGGWKGSDPAVTMTDAAMVMTAMERAGLRAYDVASDTSHYRDRSLCQSQHGEPPDVFFVEGQKLQGALFAPHCDDEALWAAFTVLRYRPQVVVCFKSVRDYGSDDVREAETRDAATILGAQSTEYWNGGDLVEQMRAFDALVHPARVWAPDRQASHPDHLAVAVAAETVFGARLTTFHTYDATGKVRSDRPVEFEREWTETKLRALARYTSQILHPRANQWFMNDLFEFYGKERS